MHINTLNRKQYYYYSFIIKQEQRQYFCYVMKHARLTSAGWTSF